MTTILAIETSTTLASVALLHNDQVLMRQIDGTQTHSQTVLPTLQQLFVDAGVAPQQCDVIAFGAGPGSFTGVRTACGIAQGLAFGLDLPVIPVVTLHAMAQACKERTGATDVLVALDARMGEVYWAQYRYTDGWETIIEPRLSDATEVVPDGQVQACGNGFAVYATQFAGAPFASTAHSDVMPHAAQVAQLARVALANGCTVPAREAQPVYLRNKVALTTSERMAKAGA
jgi:tRNA threonylcarbamoyladenosine biosynthesis protein TsaB